MKTRASGRNSAVENEDSVPKKVSARSSMIRKSPAKERPAKALKTTKSGKSTQKRGIEKEDVDCLDDVENVPAANSDAQPLVGRVDEFNSLVGWIGESIEKKKPLTIYISGTPGTGKTATIKKMLAYFRTSLSSCMLNCASISTQSGLLKAIFEAQGRKERATMANFRDFVVDSRRPLLVILDEVDQLSTRSNSILYSTFQWPVSISPKIIIIGIANSIDLTERILPKLMLVEPPKRIVFEPYSKEKIVEILTHKMKESKSSLNEKAVELCARKVAAMSGDLRTALQVFKQTSHLDNVETSNGCREVLGVLNNVYSSALSRAKIPLQPRLLLAVCLTLSASKKGVVTKTTLMNAYEKACDAIHVPKLDDDDLLSAFQTLESQSFIRILGDGKIVLQVDTSTARAAISDKAMLDQISFLNF